MTAQLCGQLKTWNQTLTPAMSILSNLAGDTESHFLQLGASLQDFSCRSSAISATANELVELLAGSESIELSNSLGNLFTQMDNYLSRISREAGKSCDTLEQIMKQLDLVVGPLEGFRKMDKALRMLSISTKIESSRLGELGAGFITLAMDVEKLSQAVSEKSAGIMTQRIALAQLINANLDMVHTTEAGQHSEGRTALATINKHLETLAELNRNCTATGSQTGSIAEEVAADIGTVVSSMQFHDITRQQLEHVIEALEKIHNHCCSDTTEKSEACPEMIAEIGDTCELQTAQTRHAIDQLVKATTAILDSLRNIGAKQTQISFALQQVVLGNNANSDDSLLKTIESGIHRVSVILNHCDNADKDLITAMSNVSQTISEIGSFVKDIEAVGSEIDLIALNAQIKAAHTGPQGAALGVLAEAIKRLSLDAVTQTEAVSTTLQGINRITAEMSDHSFLMESAEQQTVQQMEHTAHQFLSALSAINRSLMSKLSTLATEAESLADDITSITCSFTMHEQVQQQSEQAVGILEQICREARALVPASSEFRDNLRHMEQRYTMESERMIHEMLAARHGVKLKINQQQSSGSGSEYGDNVDLF